MVRVKLGMLGQWCLLLVFAVLLLQFLYYVTVGLRNQLTPKYLHNEMTNKAERFPTNNDDLHIFVHLSDLHISKFHDPGRVSDLKELCTFMKKISPLAVVVTGDLTDSKQINFHGSQQFEDEWINYKDIIDTCGISQWLDIRGNHDTFDSGFDDSNRNYYKHLSSQGTAHSRSYMKIIKGGANKTIGFVGLDLTPVPGLKRPFNFFGLIAEHETNDVKTMLQKSQSENDYSLVFGHYPSSAVLPLSDGTEFRNLLQNRIYFSGHFHTAYGKVMNMYTRHQSGLTEFELGDWKEYRRYRIFAFDQGSLTLSDNTFHSSKEKDKSNLAVIVTNPKSVMFDASVEELHRTANSEQIRILVFADKDIEAVHVGLPLQSTMSKMTQNAKHSSLYTLAWNPHLYETGLHFLNIKVEFSDGTSSVDRHPFSLDGSQIPYPFFARLILMLDWFYFTRTAFSFITVTTVLLLLIGRLCHKTKISQETDQNKRILINRKSNTWMFKMLLRLSRKLWLLSAIDKLFWPFMILLLYPCFFPWAIGWVLSDQLGIIFAWGIILIEEFTLCHSDLVYVFAITSTLFQTIPLMYVTANASERALFKSQTGSKLFSISFIWRNLGFLFIMLMQSYLTWTLYCTYGFVSILSPWGLVKLFYMAYVYLRASLALTEEDLHQVKQIWPLS